MPQRRNRLCRQTPPLSRHMRDRFGPSEHNQALWTAIKGKVSFNFVLLRILQRLAAAMPALNEGRSKYYGYNRVIIVTKRRQMSMATPQAAEGCSKSSETCFFILTPVYTSHSSSESLSESSSKRKPETVAFPTGLHTAVVFPVKWNSSRTTATYSKSALRL